MGAGWNATPLVRGCSQQSLNFTWAVYSWFWRALQNQQSTVQARSNDLLTHPTNQRGCIPYHACAEQRYTQHRVGHLVISFGSTKPPATPWRWGQSQSLKHRKTITSWHSCLPGNISLNRTSFKTFSITNVFLGKRENFPTNIFLQLLYTVWMSLISTVLHRLQFKKSHTVCGLGSMMATNHPKITL